MAVVVGAGMGGLVAAVALSDFSRNVLIIERDERLPEPAHESAKQFRCAKSDPSLDALKHDDRRQVA